MTVRLSSMAAQALATQYGLAQLISGCVYVYSGAQPASADLEPTGDLLAVITRNGKPEASPDGLLTVQLGAGWGEIEDARDWVMVARADGVPIWWRAVARGHLPQGSGQEYIRMDGAVGESLDLDGVTHLQAGQKIPVAFCARVPQF